MELVFEVLLELGKLHFLYLVKSLVLCHFVLHHLLVHFSVESLHLLVQVIFKFLLHLLGLLFQLAGQRLRYLYICLVQYFLRLPFRKCGNFLLEPLNSYASLHLLPHFNQLLIQLVKLRRAM